ncbi:MAG TPA: hypothetical protein VFU38_11275 [Candidatus Krumholzibacteria bacterium]|nr:hypothetical protein [Candidatus Krumholzibacteria bacterium]
MTRRRHTQAGVRPIAAERARSISMAGRVRSMSDRARGMSERGQRIALAVLVLATRLPLLLRADFVSYDGTYYINQAKALLHGSLGGGAFPIGYPLVIAPVMLLVRDGVLAAALVSLGASIGSVLVFESICRRRLPPSLSLLAAVVLALTPLFMRVSVLSVSESVYTFWVLLAFHQLDRRPWATGLAIGMAAATRPEALAIAGALGIAAVYRTVRRPAYATPRALAGFALCFFTVYGASVAAMSAAHGRFTPLSRAEALKSIELPWQFRERTIAFEGKEKLQAAIERDRPDFDRGTSYAQGAVAMIAALARHLMVVIPALAVVGVVVHRGVFAVALIPLIFIPFFTEARGQSRWLVPYLPPLIYYAMLTVERLQPQRVRRAALALMAVLALVSFWANRGVFSAGVENEFEPTREVARRFASRIEPGDMVGDRKPYFAFYSGAQYAEIPAAPYHETIAHMDERGVRYLALNEKTIDRLRPALRPLVYDAAAVRGELRYRQIVHEDTGDLIYERTGRADSLSLRRLTEPEEGDLTPSWSPDGRRVAFRRYIPGGEAAICMVERDGSNLRELARTSRERDPIAWSPDGAHVVYTTRVDDNFELVSIHIDSKRTTRVVSTHAHEWSPSYARSEGRLVFCSDRGDGPAAWMLGPGEIDPLRISPPRTVADLASVSPSGRRAAWVDVEGRLILWNLESNEGVGVYEPRGVISPASWSPDERAVVVEAYDWGAAHLYLVDSQDGRALLLTNSRSGEGMPSWSPDGSEIAAVTARGGPPSVWIYSNLEPFLDRLSEPYDVWVLKRPEQLRTKPPQGLRRVIAN